MLSVLEEENGVELARAPAPGARRHGRWRSLLLVGVALLLSAAMGLTNSAPANAWIGAVVPVAKGVAGVIATTVAGEVVFTKNDDGGDSEDSKKARGKWGNRMKGLPGLAAGLLGGMVGWLGLGDMIDGVKAPEDFAQDVLDVHQDDLAANKPALYRNWTIDPGSVRFDVHVVTGVQAGPGMTVEATCGVGRSDLMGCPQPGTSAQLSPGGEARCFNATTGEFYNRSVTVVLNGPPAMPLCWRQTGESSSQYVNDQVQSFLFRSNPSQNTAMNGYPEAVRVFNPNFDDSLLPEDQQTSVTADGVCRLPDGSTVTVSKSVRGLSVIPTVQCPEGSVPESVDWTSNVGGNRKALGGVGTDWSPFPACAGFKCEKLITVDDVPCRVGIEACYDWQNVDPGRVKCEYGPYALGLAECSDLQHLYKTGWGVTQDPAKDPQRQPGWLPSNPDGTVDWTRVGPEYRPEDNPNPEYKPPVRWTPENPPSTNPTPTPTATPPAGPPTSGPNPPVTNNPPDLDEQGKNCIAAAWSYNPVDWVFVPVKCALTWAFVPKPAAAAAINTNATNAITGTGLSDWMGVPASLRSTIPAEGGCRGPELALPASMGGGTYYPINACQHPLSRAAEMSRAISSLVIGVAGAYSILNSLSLALTGYRLIEPTTKDVDR